MSPKVQSRKIQLQRSVSQRTNDDVINRQVAEIIQKALTTGNGRGWTHKMSKYEAPKQTKGQWVFNREVTLRKEGGQAEKEEKQFWNILRQISKSGSSGGLKRYPWIVLDPKIPDDAGHDGIKSKMLDKDFSEIETDKKHFFDHIFDRDPHIQIIYSSIKAALTSNWHNRFHSILFGPPGCGKSEICRACADMLGENGYLLLDATSTTKAGAEALLLDRECLPRVIIVEEIEKADEKSLPWLLGILDQRAQIIKTNARRGREEKSGLKMLCIATANDIELFKKVMSGALASRFSNEIYCQRPNREILAKILEREIKKIKGRMEWIEPALTFCWDIMQEDDPRKILPVCLCGQDGLLDGSYQKDKIQTMSDTAQKKYKARLEEHRQNGYELKNGVLVAIAK